MSKITFVTAFVNVDKELTCRPNSWRLQHFTMLAETGIQICVFVSTDYYELVQEMVPKFPNIYLMPPILLKNTRIAQICSELSADPATAYTLPQHRNIEKDTETYMQTISSKMQFVQDAIVANPWKSSHFAWIDFSVAHILKDVPRTQRQLRAISNARFQPSFFAIPVYDQPWSNTNYFEEIYWRFLGGFFIGDAHSVSKFCTIYLDRFPEWLRQHRKLVWEVNWWGWMEKEVDKTLWDPLCYPAIFDDTIVCNLPEHLLHCAIPSAIRPCIYVPMDGYYASSAAYLRKPDGTSWLNLRYVNYFILPNGQYQYSKGTANIPSTKNLLYCLDNRDKNIPAAFCEMNASTIDVPILQSNPYAYGIEDIRLFVGKDGRTQFIGTTVEYSPVGCNRMIIGDYCTKTASYSNCHVIIPPEPSNRCENNSVRCEKNWIPVQCGNDHSSPLRIIYQWAPMQIGHIVDSIKGKQLVIDTEYSTEHFPWFSRFRGSTTFTECKEGLVGLVHFSEETIPRQYYHVMMLLDRDTLRPIKYSAPFYFGYVGIEFCIGMCIEPGTQGTQGNEDGSDVYVFWVSQIDRNPIIVRMSSGLVWSNFVTI